MNAASRIPLLFPNLLAAAFTLLHQMAESAEMTVETIFTQSLFMEHKHEIDLITISGTIETDDGEKFKKIIESMDFENLIGAYGPGAILSLNSKGGRIDEALEIAKSVNENDIATLLEPNSVCKSSCAFIFMAGRYPAWEDNGGIKRMMHPTAILGFHAPYGDVLLSKIGRSSGKETISIDDIFPLFESTVQSTNATISEIVEINPSGWSQDLLFRILLTPRDNYVFVDTVEKAIDWEIEIVGLQKLRPKIEDIVWTCLNMSWRGGREAVAYTQEWMEEEMSNPNPDDYERQIGIQTTGNPFVTPIQRFNEDHKLEQLYSEDGLPLFSVQVDLYGYFSCRVIKDPDTKNWCLYDEETGGCTIGKEHLSVRKFPPSTLLKHIPISDDYLPGFR